MKIFTTDARQIGVVSLVSAGLLALLNTPATAACLAGRCSQNGLVFSEASQNFRITDVTGAGTPSDPFVVYQDVWGLDISVAVDHLPQTPQHSVFNRPGFAISLVSRNLTGAFWRFYDHELREKAGYASSENDGLSFAQGIGPVRPYTSSHYQRADEITDVRDFINFYGGAGVRPGETVRFNYFVTDTIPNHKFYIRQRPDYRANTTPTPKISPQPPSPPVINKPAPASPPLPTPKPVSPPELVSSEPAQPIPEPSTPLMGALAILCGMWVRQRR
ncbi:MAG: hypothetical protein AAGI69_18815 [Cyanobacteria bacterium P01_H01_bin.21]